MVKSGFVISDLWLRVLLRPVGFMARIGRLLLLLLLYSLILSHAIGTTQVNAQRIAFWDGHRKFYCGTAVEERSRASPDEYASFDCQGSHTNAACVCAVNGEWIQRVAKRDGHPEYRKQETILSYIHSTYIYLVCSGCPTEAFGLKSLGHSTRWILLWRMYTLIIWPAFICRRRSYCGAAIDWLKVASALSVTHRWPRKVPSCVKIARVNIFWQLRVTMWIYAVELVSACEYLCTL